MESVNIGISHVMLKEARKLYSEFESFNDVYQKYVAFLCMSKLKELFPSCSDISFYYQVMNAYVEKHLDIIYKLDNLYNEYFNNYAFQNFGFFESNIPPVQIPRRRKVSFIGLENYNVIKLLESFLWNTSHHLYRFYKKSARNGKLLSRNPNSREAIVGYNYGEQNGVAISNSAKRERSYVYVNSMKNIVDLSALVHEIGHAYFFKIVNYDYKKSLDPESEMKVEIPSRMLEYLFILYLERLNVPEAMPLKEQFFELMYYDRTYKDLFERYKYSLGDMIAIFFSNTINDRYSLESFYRMIYFTNVQKLVLEVKKRYDDTQKSSVLKKTNHK